MLSRFAIKVNPGNIIFVWVPYCCYMILLWPFSWLRSKKPQRSDFSAKTILNFHYSVKFLDRETPCMHTKAPRLKAHEYVRSHVCLGYLRGGCDHNVQRHSLLGMCASWKWMDAFLCSGNKLFLLVFTQFQCMLAFELCENLDCFIPPAD